MICLMVGGHGASGQLILMLLLDLDQSRLLSQSEQVLGELSNGHRLVLKASDLLVFSTFLGTGSKRKLNESTDTMVVSFICRIWHLFSSER